MHPLSLIAAVLAFAEPATVSGVIVIVALSVGALIRSKMP